MGDLLKVHEDTKTKKARCEAGNGCSGWNKDVYDGYFDRCGLMDPFEIWKRHVKQKDYDESLDTYMDLYDFAIFEKPGNDKHEHKFFN